MVYKDNFAVITGTVELEGTSEPMESYKQTNFNVDYPSGFNQNNCIAIGFDVRRDIENQSYAYGYAPANLSIVAVNSTFPRTIQFNSNNMLCAIYNSATARTIEYKIVLMKI